MACFVAAIFCFGAGHGSLDIAMNAQAVLVEKRHRRPIMSSFHALFSAGGLTGAAVGGLVASAGVRPSVHFAAVGIVAAVAGLLAFRHLLDDRAEATHGDAGTVAFRLPSRGLIAVGALAFCAMVGEGAMADWSGIFLHEHLGAAAGVAALGYAAFSIAMTAMRFLGDWLCERIGPRGLVRLSGILAAGGMGMVLLAPSSIGVIAGFACTGAGFATVVPLAFSAAGRTHGIPAGIALSTVTTVGYLGFLIGPPLIGFAAELVGLRLAIVAIFITSALIGLLAPAAGGRKAAPQRSSRRPLVPYLVGSAG